MKKEVAKEKSLEPAEEKSFGKRVWEWCRPIGITVIATWLFTQFVYGFSIVPSGSMYPTIDYPSFIVVDHLATEFGQVQRDEIVTFHPPDEPSKIFVKRVIGLPGDTVEVHDGHVYINGKVKDEPFLGTVITYGNFGPVTVPAGHYFMMGDNRNNSDDSRLWTNKFVDKSALISRAEVEIYPSVKALN